MHVAMYFHRVAEVFRVAAKHGMQTAQAVVRDGSEEVVRQVKVLSDGENRETQERIHFKNPGVRNPATPTITMLHHLAQHHE